MSASFILTGSENILRIFRDFPEMGYRKPIITGFRAASEPVRKAMISGLPSELAKLRKVIKGKPGKGKNPSFATGAFGRQGMYKNRRGQLWDPYQLIYWFNYGTLSKRYAGHDFVKARKPISAKWRGGLIPGLFMERAWEQTQGEAQKIIEDTFDKEAVKFMNSYALK
jgi:hypothetical protein